MDWDITKQYTEEEVEFFKSLCDQLNIIYHDVLLKSPYLSYPQAKENIQHSFENLYSSFMEVLKKTSESVDIKPANEKELGLLRELNTYLEKSKELLEKPYVFHYFGDLVETYTNFFGYSLYRYARGILEEKIIIDGKSPRTVYKSYESILFSFLKKWQNEFYANLEEKSIITFAIIDSLDNTIFPKLITSRNPRKILLEEVPEIGMKKFFQKSIKDKVKKWDYKRNCYINNCRAKGDKERYSTYLNKLKQLTMEYVV
ncbi:MAG: hypothetical protein QXG39_02945 [Candidatus Aenigmatarchaeota archaeon]